jgi:hypothetical protein
VWILRQVTLTRLTTFAPGLNRVWLDLVPCVLACQASEKADQSGMMQIMQCLCFPCCLPCLRQEVRQAKQIDVSLHRSKLVETRLIL